MRLEKINLSILKLYGLFLFLFIAGVYNSGKWDIRGMWSAVRIWASC